MGWRAVPHHHGTERLSQRSDQKHPPRHPPCRPSLQVSAPDQLTAIGCHPSEQSDAILELALLPSAQLVELSLRHVEELLKVLVEQV